MFLTCEWRIGHSFKGVLQTLWWFIPFMHICDFWFQNWKKCKSQEPLFVWKCHCDWARGKESDCPWCAQMCTVLDKESCSISRRTHYWRLWGEGHVCQWPFNCCSVGQASWNSPPAHRASLISLTELNLIKLLNCQGSKQCKHLNIQLILTVFLDC